MTEQEIQAWEREIKHVAKMQKQRRDRVKSLFDETDDRLLETQAIEQAEQDRVDLVKRLIISFFLLFITITVLKIWG